MKRVFLILWMSLFLVSGIAQIGSLPVVKLPEIQKPANPLPNTQPGMPNNIIHNPHDVSDYIDIQQNAAVIREAQENEHIMEEIRLQRDIMILLEGRFPYQYENDEGASYFREAYSKISGMLEKDSLDLGRTIFLVENAYYGNTYNYQDYRNAIQESVKQCRLKIEDEKLNPNDNLTKNMMIFRYISDTLVWRDMVTKKNYYHYPVKYDYDDYDSKDSYDSHFVTKLMRSGKGQCFSMPLYYLVLAEEMGAEAYFSLSPKHSFVKIQHEGKWYNLELTCNAVLSDAHYMNSGYIKAEAIQNRLFLEPMDKRNTIASMLLQLARGYYDKYGYDDFYMECVNTAKQYLTNEVDAQILQSAYQTRLTLILAKLLNAPNPEKLKEVSPEAYVHYELMLSQYNQIDATGYQDIPEEIYARWLKYIASEIEKSEKLPSIFLRLEK